MNKVKKGDAITATSYNSIIQSINSLNGNAQGGIAGGTNKGGFKVGAKVFQFDVMESDDIDTGISAKIAGGELILEKNIFAPDGKHKVESKLVKVANADLTFKAGEELAIQWDGTKGTLINFQESEQGESESENKPIKLKIGKFTNEKLNGDSSNFLLYHSYTHSPKIQINPQVLKSEAFGIKNINWIVEDGRITGLTAEVNEGQLIEQKHSNVEFYKYGECKPKPEGCNTTGDNNANPKPNPNPNPDEKPSDCQKPSDCVKCEFPKLLCFYSPDIKTMDTCIDVRTVPVQADFQIVMNETQNIVELSFDLEFENGNIAEITCISDTNNRIKVSKLDFIPEKNGATATLVITQYISGNYHYTKPISVPAPTIKSTCESEIKFITQVDNSQECGKSLTFDNFGRLLTPYGKGEEALKLDLRVSGLAPLAWDDTDRSMSLGYDSCEKELGMGKKIKLSITEATEAKGDDKAIPSKLTLCIIQGCSEGCTFFVANPPLHSDGMTLGLCLDTSRITTINNDKINLAIKNGKLGLCISKGCVPPSPSNCGGIDTAEYPLEIKGSCIKLNYSTYCHLLPNGTGAIQLIKNEYNELDLSVVSLGNTGGLINCIDMNTYSEALAFGDCMNVYSTIIYYKLTLCGGMLGMKISRDCM